MLSAGQYRDVAASGVTARTVESAGTASRLGSEPQARRLGRPKHADRRNKIGRLRIVAMDIPGNDVSLLGSPVEFSYRTSTNMPVVSTSAFA
jgi:hypothetical protein